MKLLCEAIRAVTVELCGVMLVVGMLAGFAAMGLHSASGQEPMLRAEVADRLETWKKQVTHRFSRQAPANAEHCQPIHCQPIDELLASFGEFSPLGIAATVR